MRIVLIGGHLTPAEAFLQELAQDNNERLAQDGKVLFFGRLMASVGDDTLAREEDVVSQYPNVEFIPLPLAQLSFFSFFNYLTALIKTLTYLNKFKPDFILSFGGYLSVPVCLAAWILRVPIFIHEQTRRLGLANRLAATVAKKIFLAHQADLPKKLMKKAVVVGNPLRKEVFSSKPSKTLIGLVEKIKKENDRKIIMATGGNQGAHQLNRLIHQSLPQILKEYLIIHQTGMSKTTHDYGFSLRLKNKLRQELAQYYFPYDYLSARDMGFCLRKADLVISRAGANTVWELAVLQKKVILLPLLTGRSQEQLLNARWLKQVIGAVVIEDRIISATDLLKAIEVCLRKKVKEQSEAVVTNAAEIIIEIIKKLLNLPARPAGD